MDISKILSSTPSPTMGSSSSSSQGRSQEAASHAPPYEANDWAGLVLEDRLSQGQMFLPNTEQDEASSASQPQEEEQQPENTTTCRLTVADILNHAPSTAHPQQLSFSSSLPYVSPYSPALHLGDSTPPRPAVPSPADRPNPLVHGFRDGSRVESRASLGMNMLNSAVVPAQVQARQAQPLPQVRLQPQTDADIAERRERVSIASLLSPNPEGSTVNRVLVPDTFIGLAAICEEGEHLKKGDRPASFLPDGEESLFAPALAPQKASPPGRYSQPDGMGVYVQVPGNGSSGAVGKRKFEDEDESDEEKRRRGLVFDYCGGVWMKRLLKIDGDLKRRRLEDESESEDEDSGYNSHSDSDDEEEDEDGQDGEDWRQRQADRLRQLMFIDTQRQQLVEETEELSQEEEQRRGALAWDRRAEEERFIERLRGDGRQAARLRQLELIEEERERLMRR